MNNLEQRVTALEELVQQIIALPHLSNLAGRDSRNFVLRLKMAIDNDRKRLASDTLSDDERKKIEESITRNEYLVSPALSAQFSCKTLQGDVVSVEQLIDKKIAEHDLKLAKKFAQLIADSTQAPR